MNTGYKIKELRIKKGLTQQELGDLLGIQKAAVNKYETGRVVNLKRSTIKRLCEIFDVMPDELLGLEESGVVAESADPGYVSDTLASASSPSYQDMLRWLKAMDKEDQKRLYEDLAALIKK